MSTATQRWRKAVASTVMCSFVLSQTMQAAHAAPTDISDIPMAVKNLVAPNIMFMLDNSGSMSNIVPDTPYALKAGGACGSPATVISGGAAAPAFPAAGNTIDLRIVSGVQQIRRVGATGPSNLTSDTNRPWGTTKGTFCFDPNLRYNARLNADTTCGSEKCPSGYLDAVYTGDFLNWYFSNSGKAFGSTATRRPDTKTRMEVAQAASKAVLQSLTGVRVGLSTYNTGDGGALLQGMDSITTNLASMNSKIEALKPSGNTPLSETLSDIGRYFTTGYTGKLTMHPNQTNKADVTIAELFDANTGTDTRDGKLKDSATAAAPIQYYCQKSFAVLMTDGQPQGDQRMSANLVDYKGEWAANAPKYADFVGGTSSAPGGLSGKTNNFGRKVARTYESEGSDYLDDVAAALYDVDLRPDLKPATGAKKEPNNVHTYTIGFADEQAKADPLMQSAADAGHGLFKTAGNTQELVQAFTEASEDILGKDGAAAAVAVANANLQDDNSSYVSSYNSGSWIGDLVAYPISTDTGLPDVTKPIWTTGCANPNKLVDPSNPAKGVLGCSAQTLLEAKTSATRNIITYTGLSGIGQGIQFQPTTAGTTTKLSATQQALLNTPAVTPADGAAVVNYLRGDTSGEGKAYRDRAHLLGDIINGEPVVVSPPLAGYGDTGYSDFKKAAAGRARIVLQGANDGMLHAFNGLTGVEEWAYVPNLLLGSLNNLSRKSGFVHKYYVDATPVVGDVDFAKTQGGSGAADWRSVAVGGLGKGGRGYYALDVTTTTAASEAAATSKVLWEFPNSATSGDAPKVGFTFGRPIVTKTKAAGWVVLVTSGYNNDDGLGYLFVLNARTGAVIKAISTGVGTKDTPSGLTHISGYVELGSVDNTVEYVYGGDLLGNLWRFDFTGATTDSWKAVQLASMVVNNVPQPITTEPELAKVNIGSGVFKRFVYVGTGLYLGDSDVPGVKDPKPNQHASQTQSMYGLVDDLSASPATITRAGLVQQTFTTDKDLNRTVTSNAMDFATKKGWYVDLPVSGERVNTSPSLALGVLVFTSNIPNSTPCVPGGSSYFNVLDYQTGGAVEKGTLASLYLGEALASRAVLEKLPVNPDAGPGSSSGSSSGSTSSGSGSTSSGSTSSGSSSSSSGGGGCSASASKIKGVVRLSTGETIAPGVPSCGGGTIVTRKSWRELMR